jgi:hypothetical protein
MGDDSLALQVVHSLSCQVDGACGIVSPGLGHVIVQRVPRCCHSLDSLSTSGDIAAFCSSQSIGGFWWLPLHILLILLLDLVVVGRSWGCVHLFQCMG